MQHHYDCLPAWVFQLLSALSALTRFRCCLQGSVSVGTSVLLQSFNLAHNNFTGVLPSFLAESSVPTLTKSGISLLVTRNPVLSAACVPPLCMCRKRFAHISMFSPNDCGKPHAHRHSDTAM